MVDSTSRTGLSPVSPQLARPFVRIPGHSDSLESARVLVDGQSLSVTEILPLMSAGAAEAIPELVDALASRGLNRADTHLLASLLVSLADGKDSRAELAARGLTTLITRPAAHLEAVFIGVQLLRLWGNTERFNQPASYLRTHLVPVVRELRLSPELPRKQLSEIRYVLLRSFESPILHEAALGAIREALICTQPKLVSERKELAGAVISSSNSLRLQSESLASLKRLASAVFATGLAPAHLRAASDTSQQKRVSFLITAQDAERRRQFGLATAIELHKAATLLGRSVAIQEHEIALTFHNDASAATPGNQSWFTRDEWLTAQRLLTLATEEGSMSSPEALVLLNILATRVKAEDPADSRVSFKRPDLIDYATRHRAHVDILKRAEAAGIDAELFAARCEAKALELFDATFLLRNPIATSLENVPARPADSSQANFANESAINLGTRDLVARLCRDANPTLVARLVPADFEALRRAEGLTADQFKVILDRIRSRAISDSWARIAFLEILRAPHDPAVTASVRTGALGALVSEARRLGRLTPAFEKEVFAVSAELPHLTHVSLEESSSGTTPLS